MPSAGEQVLLFADPIEDAHSSVKAAADPAETTALDSAAVA